MAVQKAFDTLTDVPKRRAYDSSLEFDDNIPGKRSRNAPAEMGSQECPHARTTAVGMITAASELLGCVRYHRKLLEIRIQLPRFFLRLHRAGIATWHVSAKPASLHAQEYARGLEESFYGATLLQSHRVRARFAIHFWLKLNLPTPSRVDLCVHPLLIVCVSEGDCCISWK